MSENDLVLSHSGLASGCHSCPLVSPSIGLRDVILDIEANGFIGTDNGNGNGNAKSYTFKFEKDELGKNYTFTLKEGAVIYWQRKYEVAPPPVNVQKNLFSKFFQKKKYLKKDFFKHFNNFFFRKFVMTKFMFTF